MSGTYSIRKMKSDEIALALDWAAQEGWNPGLSDSESFFAADREGFLVGELDGVPAACISAVKYEPDFGFIGFYIVRPEFRGNGYGWKIWQEAMKYLEGRNIALDGVAAQQENYKKTGFKFAYNNIRYEGVSAGLDPDQLQDLSEVSFEKIAEYDRKYFPAERSGFLRKWINAPGGKGVCSFEKEKLNGYGFIRPCREGYKIGPLFAEAPRTAELIFLNLISGIKDQKFFLDIPRPNNGALHLAGKYSMRPVFETARMYTKQVPEIDLNKVFGVTSFELG